ncbi:hypothetical protein SAMN06264365_13133 [Actinoplanes regularis]|uniref:Uncharacterized protein n=1 Tax=Actinoplanes regularis TaxID=52697 RepID=A0A239IVI5_9ACTN|nr:hypothetical protein SAMN06264365_13133 [Actinoplanes regularis]
MLFKALQDPGKPFAVGTYNYIVLVAEPCLSRTNSSGGYPRE